MELLDIVRVIVVLVLLEIKMGRGFQMNPELTKKSGEMCEKISKDPYFDHDVVVGKPWRIYYTWNLQIQNRCMEMVFKNTTSLITERFWSDMYEYLEQQPYWAAASLHMTMGSANRELLLFANQGVAGSFDAVPDVVRDGNITPRRGTVPLLKFQMKLLDNNKYLVVSDCHIGVVSLAARVGKPPYKIEVAALASKLNYGEGFPACINDKRKDEEYYLN